MKFSSAYLASLFALAQLVVAKSEEFGLVAIKPSTDLHYSTIHEKEGALYFGHDSKKPLTGWITDCGYLKFSDESYAGLTKYGTLEETSKCYASAGFYVKDGKLYYNSKKDFWALPKDYKYFVSIEDGKDAVGVFIRAQGSSGYPVKDFYPNKEKCYE